MNEAAARRAGFSPRIKKRITKEEDIDRLAERVWNKGRKNIRNKADYYSVWDGYFKDNVGGDNKELRDRVFEKMQRRHPKVSSSIDTKKDRVKVFREAGSTPLPADFSFRGLSAGRPVSARKTWMVVKGVRKVVFRDKLGRFVKV